MHFQIAQELQQKLMNPSYIIRILQSWNINSSKTFEIDENFKWKTHINHIIKNIKTTCIYFPNGKTILNQQIIWINYFAIVQSLVQCEKNTWDDCSTTLFAILAVAQKSLMKTIPGKPKSYLSIELFKLQRVLDINNLF